MADDDTCRIKVICRVRPLNAKEIRSGSTVVTSFPSEKCVGLAVRARGTREGRRGERESRIEAMVDGVCVVLIL